MYRRIGLIAALAITIATTPTDAGPIAAPRIATVDPVVVDDGSAGGLTLRISYLVTGRKMPVVILSHGFHLSREDYQPLVRSMVAAGFVVIQPDHPDASIDGFAPPGPSDPDSWRKRIAQVRWIAGHQGIVTGSVPGLRARVDADRIAVVGHSFGGHTAETVMGATVIDPASGKPMHADEPTIKAAVLLSPPGHEDGLTDNWKRQSPYLKVDWSTMRGPVLTIVGGNDNVWALPQGPVWLTDGYRRSQPGRGICLMTVAGAGHYIGGIDGPLRPPTGDATPARLALVRTAVVTFLQAGLYPGDTAKAKAWTAIRTRIDCK
ncbi:alpha/beta fold hydrolase [Sphingomonas bacterium]|uniref:alpha/beta hydrolase family protein n=1 Tax=Sphingomonas bacterium TaxID=1895847 RepID=UPI0015757F80|nr:alpha/beta fold hydrolase [Sphingomonas bacterium]